MGPYGRIKKYIKLIFNRPYIPLGITLGKNPLLLHISDTPREIYPYIIRFIELLQPDYIVHTGDLIDNVKLETRPNGVAEYRDLLNVWLPRLENSSDAVIYYVMGNHDKPSIVREISKKGVLPRGKYINIEGIEFYVDHYHSTGEGKADYYLYGHSFEPYSHKKGKGVFLNGLNFINVIDLGQGQVYNLPYPLETNTLRRMTNKRVLL